jgi:hypothetical protein
MRQNELAIGPVAGMGTHKTSYTKEGFKKIDHFQFLLTHNYQKRSLIMTLLKIA